MTEASTAFNNNLIPEEKYLVANKLRLAYDEFGDEKDPAIILIMGLGTQMIAWSVLFCESLAAQGFRVIRFDNRDIGLSEKIKTELEVSIPRIMLRARLGLPFKTPYTLNDMAVDAVGVLDALEIERAHFVGASMGGMIAQLVAAEHSHRCISLTSIMSTTGNPKLPAASWKATKQLISRPKNPNEAAAIAHGKRVWAVIGSPDYPANPDELTERIRATYRRSFYPRGYRNHMAAIAANGDRRPLLQKITAPTLVIHGKADVLVPVAGGVDTAANIENAELQLIEGMGHDLPKELAPRIARMITRHAKAASS
jgi:pimeloyl-ACP methyl ester carboxylesterase